MTAEHELLLTGSIEDLLFCRVGNEGLSGTEINSLGFSFGMGAIVEEKESAPNNLGELLTVPGTAAILPALDPEHPKVSVDKGMLWSPFRVILQGMEDTTLSPLPGESQREHMAVDCASKWVEEATANVDTPSLVGMVQFAKVVSLRGSFVKLTPVPENAPAGGKPIIDPGCFNEWFRVNPDGGAGGLYALIVGVALKLGSEGVRVPGDNNIFYANPNAPISASTQVVHQHAALFRGVELPEKGANTRETARDWVEKGEILDVKHVLDDSVLVLVMGATKQYTRIRNS